MSLRTPSARHAIYAASLIALTTATAMAWAEPSPALDRASLSVGAFYTEPRIKVEATPTTDASTPAPTSPTA